MKPRIAARNDLVVVAQDGEGDVEIARFDGTAV